MRLVAGLNESFPKLHVDSAVDAAVLEKPMAALPVVESPAIASQDKSQRTKENGSTKASDVFSGAANVRAYQTKLPEIAQANMQLAFEFAQRLTQIKSPFEFPSLLSEFTLKQFAMFQKFVFPSQTNILRREKQGV
jgi:hypothetical protein